MSQQGQLHILKIAAGNLPEFVLHLQKPYYFAAANPIFLLSARSKLFTDFLGRCLVKEPRQRSTSDLLLEVGGYHIANPFS